MLRAILDELQGSFILLARVSKSHDGLIRQLAPVRVENLLQHIRRGSPPAKADTGGRVDEVRVHKMMAKIKPVVNARTWVKNNSP